MGDRGMGNGEAEDGGGEYGNGAGGGWRLMGVRYETICQPSRQT